MRQRTSIAEAPGVAAQMVPSKSPLFERDVFEKVFRDQLDTVERDGAKQIPPWELFKDRKTRLLVEELEFLFRIRRALIRCDVLGGSDTKGLTHQRLRRRPGARFEKLHAVDN